MVKFRYSFTSQAKPKTLRDLEGTVLDSNNKGHLLVPEGSANGFLTLSEAAVFIYKCIKPYAASHQHTFKSNDQTTCIKWPFQKKFKYFIEK